LSIVEEHHILCHIKNKLSARYYGTCMESQLLKRQTSVRSQFEDIQDKKKLSRPLLNKQAGCGRFTPVISATG
jgi:hypothetical protein